MYTDPVAKYNNRPHKCSCGKAYLSYPALYAHVKIKHNREPQKIKKIDNDMKKDIPKKQQQDSSNKKDKKKIEMIKKEEIYIQKKELDDGQDDDFIDQEEIQRTLPTQKVYIPPISDAELDELKNLPPRKSKKDLLKQSKQQNIVDIKALMKQTLDFLNCQNQFNNLPYIQIAVNNNLQYNEYLKKDQSPIKNNHLKKDQYQIKHHQGTQLIPIILKFISWSKIFLTYLQFKNLEVILSILISYIKDKIKDTNKINTNNYVDLLNDFIQKHIKTIRQTKQYQHLKILDGVRPLLIVSIFHKWLIAEGLTTCQLQINPNYNNNSVIPNNRQRITTKYCQNNSEDLQQQQVQSSSSQLQEKQQVQHEYHHEKSN